jgi:hypothetical protein
MPNLDVPFDPGFQLPTDIPAPEEMSAREKALRDLFVSEYLIDYDQVKAAQRCGFTLQFAQEYGRRFMEEAYVQRRLNEVRFMKTDDRSTEEYDKVRIRTSLMREAHNYGPGSTHAGRVAALSKLATLYGMEAPKKIDANIQHRGGVMAVPGIASLDDWEKQASASQDNLAAHANDDVAQN